MFNLAGLITFALIASITPGPNNVMMTSLGVSVGIRRGLPALFGIAFGIAVMILLISLGLGGFLIGAGPALTTTMRSMGLAIILWMAWRIATAPVTESDVGKEDDTATSSQLHAFIGAAIFQWVNPKAWVICASVISVYLKEGENLALQASVFSSVFVFAAILGCLPWLIAGTIARRALVGKRARIFNITMALLLVASMIPVMI
ncbi:MAG: LysE family translocator [Pseudoruegeria sp.]